VRPRTKGRQKVEADRAEGSKLWLSALAPGLRWAQVVCPQGLWVCSESFFREEIFGKLI